MDVCAGEGPDQFVCLSVIQEADDSVCFRPVPDPGQEIRLQVSPQSDAAGSGFREPVDAVAGNDLSFGNRKKVGIVCALQHDPELLILDEPTGGLDPLIQHEFFEILQEKNREGVTVFLSSHVLSEIQRHCSRAAIIREGQVIACDTVENLARSNAHRITLRGSLSREMVPDTKDWKEDGDTVSFLYSGDINRLIRILADTDLKDLTIAEPDLEEIILHYYEKGGEQA